MESIKCFACGGHMTQKTTEIESVWGDYKLNLSGITAFVCDSCGEKMVSVEEAKMIQRVTAALSEASIKPDILNLSEVARFLRISKQTVYNMIRDGRIKAHKAGREWRFLAGDIYELTSSDSAESFQIAARNGKIDADDLKTIEGVLSEDGKS